MDSDLINKEPNNLSDVKASSPDDKENSSEEKDNSADLNDDRYSELKKYKNLNVNVNENENLLIQDKSFKKTSFDKISKISENLKNGDIYADSTIIETLKEQRDLKFENEEMVGILDDAKEIKSSNDDETCSEIYVNSSESSFDIDSKSDTATMDYENIKEGKIIAQNIDQAIDDFKNSKFNLNKTDRKRDFERKLKNIETIRDEQNYVEKISDFLRNGFTEHLGQYKQLKIIGNFKYEDMRNVIIFEDLDDGNIWKITMKFETINDDHDGFFTLDDERSPKNSLNESSFVEKNEYKSSSDVNDQCLKPHYDKNKKSFNGLNINSTTLKQTSLEASDDENSKSNQSGVLVFDEIKESQDFNNILSEGKTLLNDQVIDIKKVETKTVKHEKSSENYKAIEDLVNQNVHVGLPKDSEGSMNQNLKNKTLDSEEEKLFAKYKRAIQVISMPDIQEEKEESILNSNYGVLESKQPLERSELSPDFYSDKTKESFEYERLDFSGKNIHESKNIQDFERNKEHDNSYQDEDLIFENKKQNYENIFTAQDSKNNINDASDKFCCLEDPEAKNILSNKEYETNEENNEVGEINDTDDYEKSEKFNLIKNINHKVANKCHIANNEINEPEIIAKSSIKKMAHSELEKDINLDETLKLEAEKMIIKAPDNAQSTKHDSIEFEENIKEEISKEQHERMNKIHEKSELENEKMEDSRINNIDKILRNFLIENDKIRREINNSHDENIINESRVDTSMPNFSDVMELFGNIIIKDYCQRLKDLRNNNVCTFFTFKRRYQFEKFLKNLEGKKIYQTKKFSYNWLLQTIFTANPLILNRDKINTNKKSVILFSEIALNIDDVNIIWHLYEKTCKFKNFSTEYVVIYYSDNERNNFVYENYKKSDSFYTFYPTEIFQAHNELSNEPHIQSNIKNTDIFECDRRLYYLNFDYSLESLLLNLYTPVVDISIQSFLSNSKRRDLELFFFNRITKQKTVFIFTFIDHQLN
ncbi:hypothetical protein DMUE_2991, partial [Dictyocoela muelleri]